MCFSLCDSIILKTYSFPIVVNKNVSVLWVIGTTDTEFYYLNIILMMFFHAWYFKKIFIYTFI